MKTKRILTLLIVAVMSVSFCATALAGPLIGAETEPLPDADILDVRFGDQTLSATSAAVGLDSVPIYEYASGSAGAPKETADSVGAVTVSAAGSEYAGMGFKQKSKGNTIGISFKEADKKDELTAALSNIKGFTVEASFVMPAIPESGGSTSIVGSTNGGGFGIFLKDQANGGKLFFEVGNAGGGYADALVSDTPAPGEYCHFVGVADAQTGKLSVYINGALAGETSYKGFRAGGYYGRIGVGGSTAAADTNYTNFACQPTTITGLKIYSGSFTAEQAFVAYACHMAQELTPVPEEGAVTAEPDLLKVVFGEKSLTASSTKDYMTITEYAYGNSANEGSRYTGDVTVEIDGGAYTVKGFTKTAATQHFIADYSSNKADFTASLSDGFALEAAFVVPALPTDGASDAIIGATSGGGFGIFVKQDGSLMFEVGKQTSGYADLYLSRKVTAGEYIHLLCVFDAAAGKLVNYVNGVKDGEMAIAGFRAGGYFGAVSVGGTTASATNGTNYACNPTSYTAVNLYEDALGAEEAAAAYQNHLAYLGVDVDPGTDPDPEPATSEILELCFGEGTLRALSSLTLNSAAEYSSANTPKAKAENVGSVNLTVAGKACRTYAFTKATTNNTIGVSFDKDELQAALADGFSVETSFIVPSGLSGEQYFVGSTGGSGFGVASYDGRLAFFLYDGAWKKVQADMPQAGSLCHVVATYDAAAGTISMLVNGVPTASVAVGAPVYGAGWPGGVGVGGTTASATNFTNSQVPNGTVITGLRIYSDSMTNDEAFAKYKSHMAQFGVTVTPVYDKDYDDDFEPVLRFVVGSDVHVVSQGDAKDVKLQKMLAQSYDIAVNSGNHYENLDAVVLVGDIGDNGRDAEWRAVKNTLDNGLDYDETKAIVTMGNHEFYEDKTTAVDRFEDVFGAGTAEAHYVINGYHFIIVAPDADSRNGFDYNADTAAWVEQQLKIAQADTGKDKPIFVFQHIGNQNTVIGTSQYAGEQAATILESVYRKYPQVVNFSGHSHCPLNDEASILQEYYTALGTGTLNYSTRTMVNGEYIDMSNRYSIAQNYVVEVDADSNTRIRMWDINKNDYVGETYLIESYTPSGFVYTRDRYDESDLFFAEDAQLELVRVTSNLVSVKFSPVPKESLAGRAYKLAVEDTGGKEVGVRYVSNDFFNEDYETKIQSAVGGLQPETDYVLKVYAVNPMYNDDIKAPGTFYSEPLRISFTTSAVSVGEPTADLFNLSVDAENETVSDISPNAMTAKVYGSPAYSYDETIGMDVVTFPGSASHVVKFSDYKDDADDMSYGFTMEAYFKVNEFPSSSCSPLSSQQAAGFGFDVNAAGVCSYEVHNGSYKPLTKTIRSTDLYYHWVCVYNGETLTCYVNGNKIGAISAEAPLLFPQDAGKVLFLGSDTTDAGNPERALKCSVAIARIYSQPLTESQAKALFDEVKDKRDPALYAGEDADPEYLNWTAVDDLDTGYVSFVDASGTAHSHADDSTSAPNVMNGGQLEYFHGGHLYKSYSHTISGELQCKLNFTGTAFRYVLYYRGPSGDYGSGVDVYIDGEFYKTVTGINGQNLTSRYVALEVLGLKDKRHEITFVSHDGRRVMMDAFDVVLGTGSQDDGKPIPEPEIERPDNDLFKLDSCKDGGFMAFEPTASNGYAAYYMRAKLDANQTYTVEYDVISNVEGMEILTDLEGQGGVGDPRAATVSEAMTWEHKSVSLTPTKRWQDSANEDTAKLGWPLRVYVNTPLKAQVFIDNIVVKDASGRTVLSQDFVTSEIKDVVTWLGGSATHIPKGYVPYSEGEVLGYNEIINGDFESAELMKYWWSRSDWNGGVWQREAGAGFGGSAGLVATGKGDGSSIYNAGCFYTLAGEGHEESITLKEGKTYVLTYKVFRPAGVDAYTYIDINEGQVVTAAASENGVWETVTRRFVAPGGAIKFRIVAGGLADGEKVYIDDIELRQVGGDPSGNPQTGDAVPVALLAAACVVSLGAGAFAVRKKRISR